MKTLHVSTLGDDWAQGTQDAPLGTISRAAELAEPGDTVLVHDGVYREWVKPAMGGLSDACRVTYAAAPGAHPIIKGSEPLGGWEQVEGGVWTARVPNALFGAYNPYAQAVAGDWLIYPEAQTVHTGDVYLNGKSMYEAYSLEEVLRPVRREKGFPPPWKPVGERIAHPEDTLRRWFARVERDETRIWANFGDADPNGELVEINVRPCCFYPDKTGVNYITLRGFEIAQAACGWAPPTADQPGMVGPHWSKGWIIEDNLLHDAKCAAVSLGKEITTGHNLYHRFGRKPGYQYQMEAVFLGLQAGWSREKIGGHIVRGNTIRDCGQNGVVGHMGAAFSRIERNHIYNIGVKHEFFGYEIAGIKLHAAVDTLIAHNRVHDCTLGTWLDWQAQGTRVTGNAFWKNDRDFMIEVTHGPCLVDNNVFASAYGADNCAQGTAFVHNLFCGYMRRISVLDRATPYHFPHSTQAAGCAVVYGGDDRIYNNIFTGGAQPPTDAFFAGTAGYDGFTTPEEYPRLLKAQGNTDAAKFYQVAQPVYVHGNIYAGCAQPFRAETDGVRAQGDIAVRVEEAPDGVAIEITLPEALASVRVEPVTTARLPMPRITEELYENPDGTPVDFTLDMLGETRAPGAMPGPFAQLRPGRNRVRLGEAPGRA